MKQVVGLVLLAAGGGGCISDGHEGFARMQEVNAVDPLSAVQRNRVYVLVLSDCNPWNIVRSARWKEHWQQAGFAKIANGLTPFHLGWMKHQMREIRAEDGEAVFVVVTPFSAWPSARGWIEQCRAEGLPIAQTLVLGHNVSQWAEEDTRTEAVFLEDSEAGHAEALALFHRLAAERGVPTVSRSPSFYPHAPPPRTGGNAARYPEWSFLFDDRLRPEPEPSLSTSERIQPSDRAVPIVPKVGPDRIRVDLGSSVK